MPTPDEYKRITYTGSMDRREPVLRVILARYPTFRDVTEIEMSRLEYEVLLDGAPLPAGHVMTIMGKPVVVRDQPPATTSPQCAPAPTRRDSDP